PPERPVVEAELEGARPAGRGSEQPEFGALLGQREDLAAAVERVEPAGRQVAEVEGDRDRLETGRQQLGGEKAATVETSGEATAAARPERTPVERQRQRS